MDPTLTLTPVRSAKDLEAFLRVPWVIYKNDPVWIPPLLWERKLHLSAKNPYFAHAEWQGWIARRQGRPVGRISAQVDRLYLEHHHDRCGFFGFLEAIDDESVFSLLLEQAEDWLRQRELETIQGPFNLSINQECGLLVEGFERPPVVMMPYNPPYYASRLEAQGYQPAKDLLAYLLDTRREPPQAARNLASKAAGEIEVRSLDRHRLEEEFELLRQIFNDAWSRNWGFVPFTTEEFADMAKTLSCVIQDDFVQIAEYQRQAVGMIVAIPDINQLLKGLNGQLLPFNWLRLLWRWKTTPPTTSRVILMGIRSQYRNNLVGAAIAYLLVEALRRPILDHGMQAVELSWILEDNHRIRGIIESLGARCDKRYRIYQKALG